MAHSSAPTQSLLAWSARGPDTCRFSPRTAQWSAPAPRPPITSGSERSGGRHLSFLFTTHTFLVSSTPTNYPWLGALGGQTTVFDPFASYDFHLFSPSTRDLLGQGARGPHRDRPRSTLAPFHLSHDTTFFSCCLASSTSLKCFSQTTRSIESM